MKLGFGSLQRKGRRWYLTVHQGSKLKWVALKTDNADLAVVRAHHLLGIADENMAWLNHLIAIGRRAERSIRTCSIGEVCTWQNLHDHFAALTGETPASATFEDHRRYLRHLGKLSPDKPPQSLTSADVRKIAYRLHQNYLSADRMVRFFRNVWRAMGWDAGIWQAAANVKPSAAATGRQREFYRRLTTAEVIGVLDELRACAAANPTYAELYDMVVIGYYTGLRLSDVAELAVAEVDSSNWCLKIVPNKTKLKKRRPLTIPLVREARQIVERRCRAAGEGYLFSSAARKRPTRKITAGFHRAKIGKKGDGRASFHSLRATFITLMDEAGIPPHITDSITGHGGGGMHARYTQPTYQAKVDAVLRGIPPLFP
ncbi:MAG: tyrosine recombinase XerC [Kiritimatiellia bacterium]